MYPGSQQLAGAAETWVNLPMDQCSGLYVEAC